MQNVGDRAARWHCHFWQENHTDCHFLQGTHATTTTGGGYAGAKKIYKKKTRWNALS